MSPPFWFLGLTQSPPHPLKLVILSPEKASGDKPEEIYSVLDHVRAFRMGRGPRGDGDPSPEAAGAFPLFFPPPARESCFWETTGHSPDLSVIDRKRAILSLTWNFFISLLVFLTIIFS